MVSFWLQVLAVHIIITVILVPAETQLGPEFSRAKRLWLNLAAKLSATEHPG